MGFGLVQLPNSKMGIFLGFENIEAGIKIFDMWRKRYGNEDKNDEIRISIIKGISKKHSFWYRVHVTKKMDIDKITSGSKLFTVSRFHELKANNDSNLINIENGFNLFKRIPSLSSEIKSNYKRDSSSS